MVYVKQQSSDDLSKYLVVAVCGVDVYKFTHCCIYFYDMSGHSSPSPPCIINRAVIQMADSGLRWLDNLVLMDCHASQGLMLMVK